MKTSLGTEVDLGPGHIVLDGVLAPAKGVQQPPLFGPCLLWPRSLISATAVSSCYVYDVLAASVCLRVCQFVSVSAR